MNSLMLRRGLALVPVLGLAVLATACSAPEPASQPTVTPSVHTAPTALPAAEPSLSAAPMQEIWLTPIADGKLKPGVSPGLAADGHRDWAQCTGQSVPFTKGAPVMSCYVESLGPDIPCWKSPETKGEAICLGKEPTDKWYRAEIRDWPSGIAPATLNQPFRVELADHTICMSGDGQSPKFASGQVILGCFDRRVIVQSSDSELIRNESVLVGRVENNRVLDVAPVPVARVWYVTGD